MYLIKEWVKNINEVILVENKKKNKKNLDKNFFNEMAYELAGDIGAVDNEEMVNNKKLITEKNSNKNFKKQ